MTFAQPLWFWALALLPVLIFAFFRNEVTRVQLLRKLVAARLADRLAGTVSIGKRRLRFALLLLGMAAIIFSLAQPRMGYTWEESKRKGIDVIIAIDVSRSMLSTDLAPNRLTRAKFAAQDLISQLGGDRVGLIAFAGSAFLQAPLTADFSAVLSSLNELDTEIIPRGGTNLAEAIRVATDAFGKGESDHRALIIFTDGEELDADGYKAADSMKDSVRIFGVGVGSADGSLIPVPPEANGGNKFVTDENGNFVKSRLDEERLRKIAEVTGGFYVHLQSGPAEMTQIVRDGLAKMSEKDIDSKLSRQPIERYQWPLAIGLVLLTSSMLVGERRRRVNHTVAQLASVLVLSLGFTTVASAKETPDDLFTAGKYDEAQKALGELVEKNPKSNELAFNWGVAAYKNKDLETAQKAFSQALTTEDTGLRSQAELNLGNTLFQKGAAKKDVKTLQDALGHYSQTLDLAPKDEKAQHNKKVTEDLIAKLLQKQEEQKKQDQKQDKKDPKKDDQKKDQQKDGSKDQKQDQKDGEKKDQGKDQQKDGKPDDQKDGQKDGDKDGQKDQKPGGDQQKDEPGKDGEKKDGEGRPQDSKDQDGKDGKEGEKQDPKDGQQQQPSQQAKNENGEKPTPMPGDEDKKLSGEVKANPSQAQQDQKKGEQEAAAEEQAALDGKMTERQAKALLDSLKSEDDRVRMVDPNERKRAGRALRDW